MLLLDVGFRVRSIVLPIVAGYVDSGYGGDPVFTEKFVRIAVFCRDRSDARIVEDRQMSFIHQSDLTPVLELAGVGAKVKVYVKMIKGKRRILAESPGKIQDLSDAQVHDAGTISLGHERAPGGR